MLPVEIFQAVNLIFINRTVHLQPDSLRHRRIRSGKDGRADGNPRIKRRKADDEHLIRQALLDARLIDAVISLPLNVFYGAGVPACLLILKKRRPATRRDQVLMVYAARHYRELSAQNELRPQDVMRLLVHYHAYGDAARVPTLVAQHSNRIRAQITARETQEVERLTAEYAEHAEKLAKLTEEVAALQAEGGLFGVPPSGGMVEIPLFPPEGGTPNKLTKAEAKAIERKLEQLEKQRARHSAKITERDERIAEASRRAADDRQDAATVGEELTALYADPDELLKHARVVGLDEIGENEFNLNIPRFVDTFEPEPRVEVSDALKTLDEAELLVQQSVVELRNLMVKIGYGR